jgi:hypothetical protein
VNDTVISNHDLTPPLASKARMQEDDILKVARLRSSFRSSRRRCGT